MTAILNTLVRPFSFYQFRVTAESFGKVFDSPEVQAIEKHSSLIHKAIKMAPEKHFLTSSPYYNQAKITYWSGEAKSFLGACSFFGNIGGILGDSEYFQKTSSKGICERLLLLTANLSECLSYFQGKFNIFQQIENVQIGQFRIFKPLKWIANNAVESGFGAAGLSVAVYIRGEKLLKAFKEKPVYRTGWQFAYQQRLLLAAIVEKTLKAGMAILGGSFTKSYAGHPIFKICGIVAAGLASYRAHYPDKVATHADQVAAYKNELNYSQRLNTTISSRDREIVNLTAALQKANEDKEAVVSERSKLLDVVQQLKEAALQSKKGGKTK